MKNTLLSIVIASLSLPAFAGGGIGGSPPGIQDEQTLMLSAPEFNRAALEALSRGEIELNSITFSAESLDFKSKRMLLRSKLEPDKVLIITPAEASPE